MTSEKGSTFAHGAVRRVGVVAEALAEKHQKLSFLRSDAEREQRALLSKLEQLSQRIAGLDSELEELREALAQFEVELEPEVVVVESEDARWKREQDRYMQAQGLQPLLDLYPETRHQKHAIAAEVRTLLELFGSMPLREIHRLLRTKGVDTPGLGRLSQILSESQMFEADRTKGWSLKEERPGFPRPGLSVSKTTPSGDGS